MRSGKWDSVLKDESKKRRISHTLQVDLLSKTMMTIEDLSTVSETLLDNPSKLRKNICNNSRVNFIRNKTFQDDNNLKKIFGYPDVKLITNEEDEKGVYNRLIENEIKYIKYYYGEIAEFFDKYYDFHIAFKHSYSRIFINLASNFQPVREHKSVIDEIIGLCPKRGDILLRSDEFKKWIHNENQFKNTIKIMDISFYLIDTILRTLMKKVLYKSKDIFPFEILTNGKYPKESQRMLNELVFKRERSLSKEEDFMPAIGDMTPVDFDEYKKSILEEADDDFKITELGSFA